MTTFLRIFYILAAIILAAIAAGYGFDKKEDNGTRAFAAVLAGGLAILFFWLWLGVLR